MASDEKASETDSKRLNSTAFREGLSSKALTIVVFGASGDLAKKKTYPALFDLYGENVFPETTLFIGSARSKLDDGSFKERVTTKLSGPLVADFSSKNKYFKLDGYNDEPSFEGFGRYLNELDTERGFEACNRLFYFALPPNVYADVSRLISMHCFSSNGWNRVIIEKPFGHDLESAVLLMRDIGSHLDESVVYRIDHYLAKELAQNILTLRFANAIWDRIWHRRAIESVKISFKEDITIAGRAGYYDNFGAIRDIFQNHLMQVLTLIGMEAPVSLDANDVRDEKVKLLKAVKPPSMDRVVVGQYDGYRDEPGDERNPRPTAESNQVTFFQAILFVDNHRWQGVPFICKCGKALDQRRAEVRIQFKNDGLPLFPGVNPNELVIRLQPNEAMYLKTNTKVPGFAHFDQANLTELNISYSDRFKDIRLPDAYSRLIADALKGDQNLFVREDELLESWRIVTPVLKALEEANTQPIVYPVGSRGPPEADEMAERYGFVVDETYQWPKQQIPPTILRTKSMQYEELLKNEV